MREYFGFEVMAHPDDARAYFERVFARYHLDRAAVAYFRTLRLEVGTLDEPMGGGYWFGDRNLVLLRGNQEEAALHELAHAFWERQRGGRRDDLMRVLQDLAASPTRGFDRASELARVYVHGVPSQSDPTSPTGFWRGMLAEDNDHETFAGFCSAVMADAAQLPPRLRAFYVGFLPMASVSPS